MMRTAALSIHLLFHLCHAGAGVHSEEACSSGGPRGSLLQLATKDAGHKLEAAVWMPPLSSQATQQGSSRELASALAVNGEADQRPAASPKSSDDLLSLLVAAAPRAAGLNYMPGPSGVLTALALLFAGGMALLVVGRIMQLDQMSIFQDHSGHLHFLPKQRLLSKSSLSTHPASSQQTLFSAAQYMQGLRAGDAEHPYSQRSLNISNGGGHSVPQRQSEGFTPDSLVARWSEGFTRESLIPTASIEQNMSSVDAPVSQNMLFANEERAPNAYDAGPGDDSKVGSQSKPLEAFPYMCRGFVVPNGKDCVVLVPEASAIWNYAHVSDLAGKKVMRVEMSIPQWAKPGLDQRPAVILQSLKPDGSGTQIQAYCKAESRFEKQQNRRKVYVYNGKGDLFGSLTREDRDAQAHGRVRYVLSIMGANQQIFDFEGSTLRVFTDSQELLADTRAWKLGGDAAGTANSEMAEGPDCYRLRARPNADVLLLVASLMSIQLMELP